MDAFEVPFNTGNFQLKWPRKIIRNAHNSAKNGGSLWLQNLSKSLKMSAKAMKPVKKQWNMTWEPLMSITS